MKLTTKQQRFADYYIQTGNATESAAKAGYSKKTARSIGQENLTKPDIAKYIDEVNKKLENERIADMKEIKEFWTSMFRNEIAEDKDRLKASEYLAKTNGAFLEKVEHSGEVTNNNIDMSGLSEEELRKLATLNDGEKGNNS